MRPAFANVHLRMDGSGMKSASDSGAGSVNCQFGVGPWEKFLVPTPPFRAIKWPTAADAGTSAVTAASSGSGAGADGGDDDEAWDDESGDYIADADNADNADYAGGDSTRSNTGADGARTWWEDPVTP